jgi:hypothetical protein
MLVTAIAGAGSRVVANFNLASTSIRLVASKAKSNPWGIFAARKPGCPFQARLSPWSLRDWPAATFQATLA